MKKPLLIALGVALLAAVGLFWWLSRPDHNADALTLHGNVDVRQISLAFEGGGRIAALDVQEGDHVTAGQVLGRLDTSTLALQAQEAESRIAAQQQNLLRLRNGARPQEVAQSRSRLAAAEAEAVQAQQDLARFEAIAARTDGRGVSAQDIDHARNRLRSARAKADEQRQALRLVEEGPRREDIAAAEAEVRASEAALALTRHQIEQGELRAPADAVVRSRLLEPGDMATAQRPVFALALTHPKWVRVYVAESDLGRVRLGMAASVTSDSYPDRPLTGRISYISSVAEFTPKSVQTEELRTSLVYEVRVLVDDQGDALRLGQPVTVNIELTQGVRSR